MAKPTTRQAFKDYCLNNKYSKWYFSIVDKAISRNWSKKTSPCYVEQHHIVPKSIIKNNYTVCLTAKEHFICHLLLIKMLTDKDKWKMQRALWNISHTRDIKIHSKLYNSIKEEYSKNCSKFMTGENNPMYGLSKKGKYNHTPQHKEYMRELMTGENNPMYGKKHSENTISQKSKNYTFVYNNNKIEIFNLRKYCREKQLDQGAMVKVNSSKQIQHKGYTKWQK